MKTYAISLKSNIQRWNYINNHLLKSGLDFKVIEAFEGEKLNDSDLKKFCDLEEVLKKRKWLNNGAIGCALSHHKVYKEIIDKKLPYAFVIEDDVVLPKNIKEILSQLEREIQSNEVILLYSASFQKCKLSEIDSKDLNDLKIVYPIDIRQTITATAYIISYNAAVNLHKTILPIRVAADCWFYFYEIGALKSLRLVYPFKIAVKNFKSSIDYVNKTSFTGKLLLFIDKLKVPVIYHLLKYRRSKRTKNMTANFVLTNERSPIAINNLQNE